MGQWRNQLVIVQWRYPRSGCQFVGYHCHWFANAVDGLLAQASAPQLVRWGGAEHVNVPLQLFALACFDMVKAPNWVVTEVPTRLFRKGLPIFGAAAKEDGHMSNRG